MLTFPFMRRVVFTLGDLHLMADAVVAIEMLTPPSWVRRFVPTAGLRELAGGDQELIDATLRNEDYIAAIIP